MFCNYCGSPISENESSCPCCGKPRATVTAQGYTVLQQGQSPDQNPQQGGYAPVIQQNIIIANRPYSRPQAPRKPTNRVCSVALAFGIVGLFLTVTVYGAVLGLLFAIAGFFCAISGIVKAKTREGSGKGKAIAGLVLTSVTLTIFVLIIVLVFTLLGGMAASSGAGAVTFTL